MTGADNTQVQQNIIQSNSIGVASHSSSSSIDSNLMNGNLLAGITFVNTQQSNVGMNNVVGSQNGVFLDGQSSQNTISANNVFENALTLTMQMDYQQTSTPISMQTTTVEQAIQVVCV